MKLKIENFAKIKNADIIIDGITVIAGENNTGKSTVGKILFSLFNSISGIEEKVEKQRLGEIQTACFNTLGNGDFNSITTIISTFTIVNLILKKLKELSGEEEFIQLKDIGKIIRDSLKELGGQAVLDCDADDSINDLAVKIKEFLDINDDVIVLEVLSRYFTRVFNGQVNSLTNKDSSAELELNIKEKQMTLSFRENKCIDFTSNIKLIHHAVYIDNPFIIDKLSNGGRLNEMDEYLKNLLTENAAEDIMSGIISSVLAKEKLSEIYQALQSVVDGRIVHKQNDDFFLETEGFKEPVSFNNLSTGLKSFVILKMLLEKGLIKEKDVLVLDEPEIHLHPQWQITYAELIVLLQKHFDLSIIVTTHSPYFLDAINLFSVKHGVNEKTNYYLSSMKDGNVSMALVTDHIDTIFKEMATPIQALDSLRYELNNN